MQSPKILIGIPSGQARHAEFEDYLDALILPDRTIKSRARGQSPAKNRNIIIEQALEMNCSHIFFLDDDIAVQPDTLIKLLSHDVDIVSGLYLKRNYPHKPVIFDDMNSRGESRHQFLIDGIAGLTKVDSCGLGCVLIKTSVFKMMQAYKLASGYGCENKWIRLGEIEEDQWCDDMGFFKRVKTAGIKVYCDSSCLVGHFASMIVWPNYSNKKWITTYDTSGSDVISVPQVKEYIYEGV